MSNPIKIDAGSVSREVNLGNIQQNESRNPVSFFETLSELALVDTGLLPLSGTGVLAIRQALNHTQIVFQHAPDLVYVNWGAYERDVKAKTYYLAQPWRIVIGDILDGNLLGARTFYSPVPIQTADQILYHVNLPNINCKGYRGNGVGWICLYHKHDWTKLTLSEKIRALVERASGVETYNDANMSSTDGPRFYQAHGKPDYTYNPEVWQKKSLDEGYEWTLDDTLWIPIKVKGIDNQGQHDNNGVPFTLEMAMLGRYQAYYSDKYYPKPVNGFIRADEETPSPNTIFTHINNAFTKSSQAGSKADSTGITPEVKKPKVTLPEGFSPQVEATPVVPTVFCVCCGESIPQGAAQNNVTEGIACQECMTAECFLSCVACGLKHHYENIKTFEEKLYCGNCKVIYNCANCGATHETYDAIVEGSWCTSCATAGMCDNCHAKFNTANLKGLDIKNPVDKSDMHISLCLDCFEDSVTCGCGYLKNEGDTGLLGNGIYACEPCIAFTDDGTPFFNGQAPEQQQETNLVWAQVQE